jgi:NAD(P)-dependent dehydrogenase (short-subunit alcohol dehydrogenase family)
MNVTQKLGGRAAIVTGVASGIGLATVERFVADGAQVLAVDVQADKGKALEARFPGRVLYRQCDVTSEASVKAAIDEGAAAFGGLDILFNNAGASGDMSGVADADLDGWRRTFELLLFSVVAGTKHATPHMIARGGGAIINTASIAGLQAGYGPLAYSAAKSAVIHFSRTAAADLAAHKIRINAICPGFIATSIFGASLGLPRKVADQMAALLAEKGGSVQPIGRVGEGADIAAMVAHLASDNGAFITGAHFVVDGGITIGPRAAWDKTATSPLLDALGVSAEQAEAMRIAQQSKG